MGRRSLSAGKAFEDYLDFIHNWYNSHNRAFIEYTGTRSRAITDRDGQVRFVAAKSMPDYVGVIAPMGRAIVFDAKTTQNKYSWQLKKDKVHQRDTLSRWAARGAIAFFLIERRPQNKLYLLRVEPNQFYPADPPPKIKWSDYRGRLNADGADVLKVEAEHMTNHDYLAAVCKFWM